MISPRFLPILAFGLTLALFLPFASRGVDPHHDGLMLKTALDLLGDQTLYRDTFTQYGALTAWLHELALRALGPSLLSLKLFTVLAYALAAAALTAAWQELLPRRLAALSIGAWLLFAPFYAPEYVMLPWASVPALLFQSLAAYALTRALVRPGGARGELLWPALTGAAAGLAFWSRTPVGVFLLGVLALALVFSPRGRRARTAGLGLAGFAAVGVLPVAIILGSGAGAEWIWQTFVWPRQWAAAMGGSVENILRGLLLSAVDSETHGGRRLARWAVVATYAAAVALLARAARAEDPRIFRRGLAGTALGLAAVAAADWSVASSIRPWASILPLTLAGAGLRAAWRAGRSGATTDSAGTTDPGATGRRSDAAFGALALLCLASWLQFYPITCPRHVFWSLSPAFGVFVFWFHRAAGRDAARTLAALSLLFAPLLASRIPLALSTLAAPRQEIAGAPALRGMRATPATAAALGAAAAALGDLARPVVVDGPDAWPGILAADRRNFHPFHVEWSMYRRTPAELAAREEFVRRERPWIFVQPPRMAEAARWRVEHGYRVGADLGADFGIILEPAPERRR